MTALDQFLFMAAVHFIQRKKTLEPRHEIYELWNYSYIGIDLLYGMDELWFSHIFETHSHFQVMFLLKKNYFQNFSATYSYIK